MTDIIKLLGEDADNLLKHTCRGIAKQALHLPGPDFIDRVMMQTDRRSSVLRSLGQLYNLLPVDLGIEHSAGASFAPNAAYSDPENI